MKSLIFLFSFLVTGCASVADVENSQKNSSFVGIKGGNLIYQGEITEESNNSIFSSFRNAKIKPNRLLISSHGGAIGDGLALGNWVRENNLNVEVTGTCLSSCANYVFPAGNLKYLRKDSVLIWHGSAWQPQWDSAEELSDKFKTYITVMRKKETDFYADIEVDNLLPVYGQSKISLWDYIQSFFGKGTVGYDYSIADMKKFGVKNIVVTGDEWNWRRYRPSRESLVKRIKVDDDFEFKLRRFEM